MPKFRKYSSYSARGITENYSVRYGDPLRDSNMAAGNHWKNLYFDSLKTFLPPVKLENIRIGTSLNILVTQNSKT